MQCRSSCGSVLSGDRVLANRLFDDGRTKFEAYGCVRGRTGYSSNVCTATTLMEVTPVMSAEPSIGDKR
jgi:hypothetical protein